jgi:hypothetical protein
VTGNLSGPPAGSEVIVKFTAPDNTGAGGRSEEKKVTTAADGSWSASITPTFAESGDWTVASRFEGDKQWAPVTHAACTVHVTEG